MSRRQRQLIANVGAGLGPEEVRGLLSQLCVRLGFCLPPLELERMAAAPPTGIDEFTHAVFIAEGLDPIGSDRHLVNQVREMVAEAFVRHESITID